jgi:hypothetical protein
MTRFTSALCMSVLVCGFASSVRAQNDAGTKAILDKAAKALGGEEKLNAVKAFTWKGKGKLNLMGNESDITVETIVQGLDHYRRVLEGEFAGQQRKVSIVLNGDKGWRKFGDQGGELKDDLLANEKRVLYLTEAPITLAPLRNPNFKVEAAGDEKVGDKPAAVLKVTAPDGKDFKIYFDKESGLPVKQVAKVLGLMGEEVMEETTYADYKDMGGIKKATRLEVKRDGDKWIDQEITEFKILDKVDPKTFDEPQ